MVPAEGLGKRALKVDGEAKATGRTLYTDDISLPGMLHAKIKRSTRAHAKILAIDIKAARKLEGVHAVITGQDLQVKYGVIPWTKDETPLCVDKVRYIGDAVAAVAAVDEETANLALKLIKVTYEDLLAVLAPRENPESVVNERAKKENITKHVALSFGNPDEALSQSAVVLSNRFTFHNTTHAPIEPHCAIGEYSERGLLTVTSATQVPHYLHKSLAEVLDIPESQVRVIQPALGGAFGGKSEPFDLEFVVAKLAMQTGRPVKCLYTREEVFYAHRGRHPMTMDFQMGADKTGKLLAVKSKIDIDGGAYASFGMITAFYAGQLLTGPVGFENYAFEATRFYTNKPACGPKRGHGSVQPRFAFEVQLDMVAEKLGLCPIKLRKQNAVKPDSQTVNDMSVGSLGLPECLDAVCGPSEFHAKRGKLPFGRGVGVASSMYISGTNYPVYPNDMPQSAVVIKADRSGHVTLFCGCSDIGQGANTILAQIACEELGVSMKQVRVVTGDTDLTPVDLGAYSSRVTLMMGTAAKEACEKLAQKIKNAVFEKLECQPEEVRLFEGSAFCIKDTSKNIPLTEALVLAESKFATLSEHGGYHTVARGGDYRGGTIGASPAYSCTAHIAEVEVDTQTGFIDIQKIWVAHDCGKAINPTLVEGQMEGSTYMGAAEVSMEEMAYGKDDPRRGMLLGPSLLDYRIPTSLDTPDLSAHIVECPDKNGPYGAKEAGEGPLHSSIPAVANAIYDAVGIRLFELPFTPEKVLKALAEKESATC